MAVEDNELVRRMLERKTNKTVSILTPPAPPKIEHDPDLVPDIEPYERSEQDFEIDTLLDNMDILEAYARWCGKMVPKVGSKRESIMISCPDPSHADKNPSAAINLDKQVWDCYGCNVGGDKYDIAAWHFGFNVLGYKGSEFPALRRAMAEDLGYIVRRTPGGQEYIETPADPVAVSVSPNVVVIGEPEPDGQVIQLFPGDTAEAFDKRVEEAGAFIDWEVIVPQDTFLWDWMQATTIDDLAHEYYFWLGLQALGFASGTDVLLDDYQKIKGNLFVCLYGRTGSGKTRSLEPYSRMLRDALPWDGDDYTASAGTQLLASPASAEALLRMFQHELKDPSTQKVIDRAQVRGLLRVEEFASFVARASRPTNPMKETLIELYDVLDYTIRHTSVTGGTVQAHNPFVQMVTSTQPKAIHSFLRRTDSESGFLNRWVFATGTRRRQRISYGNKSVNVDEPARMLKGIHAWAGMKHTYTLDGAPLKVWDEFFHGEIVPLHDSTDESMLSRIDLTLKKLILLFSVNSKEAQPTVETVEQAISLFPYLLATGMIFSKDIAFSEFEAARTAIIDIIKQCGREKTEVNMKLISTQLGGTHDRMMLVQVIKTMIDLGEIEERIQQGKRGPRTVRYELVT